MCVCVYGHIHLQFPLNITIFFILNLLNRPPNIINNFIIYVFTEWNSNWNGYFCLLQGKPTLYEEKLSGE